MQLQARWFVPFKALQINGEFEVTCIVLRRSRQATITTELIEIISGAAALEG